MLDKTVIASEAKQSVFAQNLTGTADCFSRKKRSLAMTIILMLPSILFAALTPEQILKRTDEVRNPQLDYTMSAKVTSVKPGRENSTSTFEVMVKGRDRTVIKTLTPAIDRGRILLMNDTNLWGFLPSVSKPLRISLQERLFGDVANGDLARANFSGDYKVKLIGVKKLKKRDAHVLELKAKSSEITYDKVILWADKLSGRPLFAEFYAVSGRLLKTCTYEDYAPMGGSVRPLRLIMKDPVNKGQYSILEYEKMNVAPLPEKYFTKDYMKKLAD